MKELNKLQLVTEFANLFSVHLETSLTFIYIQEQFFILILFMLSFLMEKVLSVHLVINIQN